MAEHTPREVRNTNFGDPDVVLQAGQVGAVHVHQGGEARLRSPVRIGVVPQRAGCFQDRDFGGLMGSGVEAGETFVLGPVGDGQAGVLSGMGGVGKTQWAADYAEGAWTAGNVELLVWVEASSREAIVSTYSMAATELGWYRDQQPDAGAQRFLEGLATMSKRWLVVLDDLQSPGDVRGLWPPNTPTGRVLATTRRRDNALAGNNRTLIPVGVFTSAESLNYLTERLADPSRTEEAFELAEDLGHLPLALAQAAAYIMDEDLDCPTYRRLLADERRRLADLVPEPDALPDDHPDPVAETWSLSIALAGRLRPQGLAPHVLKVAAILDPHGIPTDVFTSPVLCEYFTDLLGWAVDEHAVRQALRVLHRLSLLTSTDGTVRVHALVQRVTREHLPAAELDDLVDDTAAALLESWPVHERGPAHAQSLRANTDVLAAHASPRLYEFGVHPVLFQAGASLLNTGLVTAATTYFASLHATATYHLGSGHPDTLTARNNLGSARRDAGDAVGAVTVFEEVLADRLQVHGPDHPLTLTARHNLACARRTAGDVSGAVEAFKEVLPDLHRLLGSDDPRTLASRNHLAAARSAAGDIAVAIEEFEDVLDDRLRVLGPDHPGTLATRNDLACTRRNAGDVAGAMAAFEEVLADRVRVLGPEHPDTLVTRNDLAEAQRDAGDLRATAATLRNVLADRIRVLGPDHPGTLTTRHNLATVLGDAGDIAGAATAFHELLVDLLPMLGANHPRIFTVRNSLAGLLYATGDRVGAVAEFEKVLAARVRFLGPDHPQTMYTRTILASLRKESS